MRTVLTSGAALLSAALLASAAAAADVKPAVAPAGPEVHRLVILNGPTATVHYFSAGVSPGDQAYLRELERAENDASYAEDLQALRRKYVADELALAPIRRAAQAGLYGRNITRTYEDYVGSAGYWPGYAYPYAYPTYFTGYPGGYSSFASSSSVINQSLANGVGDEGALKTAMAQVIAGQATPEYTASTARAYTTALNRAAESEALRTALNLKADGTSVGGEPVTLVLKGGEKVQGTFRDEDADWITIQTGKSPKNRTQIRKADVVRIEWGSGEK
jgi:hypothetical protein